MDMHPQCTHTTLCLYIHTYVHAYVLYEHAQSTLTHGHLPPLPCCSAVLFSLMQSCVTVSLVVPANKSLPEISQTTDSRMLTVPKDSLLQLGSAVVVRYGQLVGALRVDAREEEETALEELQWKIGRMLSAQQHQRAQWELGG